MWRWLRDRFDDLREALADALESLRERLFGGEDEEEELKDEGEVEEAAEAAEEAVEDALDALVGGDVGDEYVIDLIEQAEHEGAEAVEAAEAAEAEAEAAAEEPETETEAEPTDDRTIIYELFEATAAQLAEVEHLLKTCELTRAESLLDDAATLMEELASLADDDRSAAIDLILDALSEVEQIVARGAARAEGDGACDDPRGPFVAYDDARSYAQSIPCPTWIYADGFGWWWVCMDDCSPEEGE